MKNWTIEKRAIKDLKPHPKNPRILTKHQHEHLKTSLEKFGIADKPIINRDNQIIGGHQRLRILKELGYKEIEVWVPDEELNEKEAEELCIRLNQNHGQFDWEILGNEFDPIELVEWGFDLSDLEILISNENSENCSNENQDQKCPTCGKKMKKKMEK